MSGATVPENQKPSILSTFVTSLTQHGKVVLHQKDDRPLLYQKTRTPINRESLVPEANRGMSQGIQRHGIPQLMTLSV